MFVSETKKTLTFHEGTDRAGTVTIRRLSGKSLRKAAEAKTMASLKTASAISADTMKLVGDAVKDAAAARMKDEHAGAVTYDAYDLETVLVAGVESWSYAAKLPAGLDQLDDDIEERLFKEILDLSVTKKEVAEAERKND